ncbi:GNAT family N-acetyltransferase [Aspergillus candidus]|uniref:Acyl-CoA N-acyltransferase n=1 Tax=Aspergillus candidus TaxID=41067 RepID=A0A2I2FMM9_ASPCN|nr:acyl-CoA N-acyltransferase [Aspergillus candidus]PLB41890.1 acyl-CoA N-acyltransferase [Aspergillus candidus]
MRNHICYLPNGLSFTVKSVFGGVTFRSNDMKLTNSIVPPGWNIVLSTDRRETAKEERPSSRHSDKDQDPGFTRFTTPTLRHDSLYLSSIVDPPSTEYKPVSSHARQLAMMLWVTLWWYFHEPQPDAHLHNEASAATPDQGKPKGEWRVAIRREGIFKGRNVVQKLERMGLVASEDSSAGDNPLDLSAWDDLFVSRRSFWQIDPRIFIFTMSPLHVPRAISHRPLSPNVGSPTADGVSVTTSDVVAHLSSSAEAHYTPSEGPYASSSHHPTYFPPPPTQYTFTNNVRHPIRPKPPHKGDVFYIRYIPSLQQYISFRVAYLPPPPSATTASTPNSPGAIHHHAYSASTSSLGSQAPPAREGPSDLDLLHKWMNDPRVNASWGEAGPVSKQEAFLRQNLSARHSFPVIGCWDDKPFGYFEIYWVKEDRLGSLIGGAGNYDRGIHLLIGEQEFRGPHRVAVWLSSLVHYCFLADPRTETVMLEPRADNHKVIHYLQQAGFYKEGEVTFPHKQSALMKIKRDQWECPAI